ncbi:hypothetical protein CHLRE_02g078507v5 [Chlamydomonas reinhardtii]|uniref:Uncharacterized protein n=1 Tax=Chlamydomonas reinhardtii TaxID=3055 RepID=A8IAE5_CHLRE|nr:uncharacterized protein CHLRE_02g078507v5 [Chlamydomonas reinhardtii]PNW86244.1 hypothetical protein CHLRE_02g078507v5 [Chlamydomonas reinhardtii]|eukprot:XP_001701868.1 predicted protein [Chlamydomonas reinhardtii]
MALATRPAALKVGTTRVSRRPQAIRASASARPEVAAPVDDSVAGPSRRGLMAMAASAFVGLATSSRPAFAKTCAAETETEAEDDACRNAVLNRDLKSVQQADANYNAMSKNQYTTVSGVPVAVLDSEYARATLKLREDILQYAELDIQDYKTRVPLIKTIKTEGADWVSKYARGGSARSDSARRMYIAVDALIGHLAANGYAPMPKPKLKVVLVNIDQAKDFLEIGK